MAAKKRISATRAKVISVTDLTRALDGAIQRAVGARVRDPTIIGRMIREAEAANAQALAKQVAKDVSAQVKGLAGRPVTISGPGGILIGIILKPTAIGRGSIG